jgi:peptide/nickel transport system permease protein
VTRLIARRFGHLLLVLLATSCLSMAIIDLAPGDYLTLLRSDPQISRAAIERMREDFGLDRPWLVQYGRWLGRVLAHADLGESFSFRAPVRSVIGERLANTLLLTVTATVLTWTIAVPLGIGAAVWRDSWAARAGSALALAGASAPRVILALLVMSASVSTGLFPAGGMRSAATYDQLSAWGKALDVLWHLAPPAIVMSVAGVAEVMRQTRSSLLDAFAADFLRTARAKGLPERAVILRHALRNAANPLISLFGLTVGRLLSASLIVEATMSWPGLGSLTLEAILRQDLFVLMGTLVVASALLVLGNLLADMLLIATDPRVARA